MGDRLFATDPPGCRPREKEFNVSYVSHELSEILEKILGR